MKYIKEARIKKGLSLRALGVILGKSSTYLSLIENGKRPLPFSLSQELSAILDIDITRKIPKKKLLEEKQKLCFSLAMKMFDNIRTKKFYESKQYGDRLISEIENTLTQIKN